MSRLGAAPIGVYSDDGMRLVGLEHPNGNQAVVTTLYNSVSALQADLVAGRLDVGDYKVGNRKFTFDGAALSEIAQKGLNNWPHVSIAHNLIRTFIAAQGVNFLEQHRQALEIALPPLMASTAWEKIVELWVPLGANITGALQMLKYPAGGASALTQTGTVTYSQTGGVTGDGSTGFLKSGNTLTTLANAFTNGAGMTNNGWGLAVHVPALPLNGSSLNASSVFGGVFNGGNYTYVGGQLPNEYVFGNNILQPMAPNFMNWNNGSGNIVPPFGFARMNFVQALNGTVQCGSGGLIVGTQAASGSNAVPPSFVTVCGLNGSGYSQQPITGYALFNSMTQDELSALSAFFDLINHMAYRPIMDGHIHLGDSISRGAGLASPSTQCWPALYSGLLGIALGNYAQDGSTLSVCPYLGNTTTPNTYPYYSAALPIPNGGSEAANTYRLFLGMQGAGGASCSLALGINDLSYSGNLAAYSAALTQTLMQLQQHGWNMSALILPSITCATSAGGSVASGYYTPALAVKWNTAIQQIANQFGCIYVDFYTPIAANPAGLLQADGFHPNAAGHFALAQAAYNAYAASRQATVPNYVSSN